MVSPVGAYYKGAMSGVDGVVIDNYDRCAPKGEIYYLLHWHRW